MGLDMYLKASKYVSGFEHSDKEEVSKFNKIVKAIGLNKKNIAAKYCPGLTVEVNIGYWRKANAIHKWFVDKVQNGVDECQRSYVSREQLKELLILCNKVLNNSNDASASLPTQSGVFFGGLEYDDGYIDDMKNTIEIINNALSDKFDGYEFYYRSSW